MANIQITQLPAAGSITGTELVPIVQNGVTVQTTTGAIAASPSQTQTFLTKNNEPSLPNSRYLSSGTGIGLTDGGAQSFYRIVLNGTSGSLESASTGIIAKTAGSTVTPRTLTASGNGITITNGDGVSGNPTFELTGLALAIANASGTGMLAVVGGSTIAGRQITGTTNQINVVNGNGSGNPTVSITDNVILPGTGAMTVVSGTSAQQPVGSAGQFRFNTTTQTFDGYASGSWRQFSVTGGVTSFSAGSTGFTPNSDTSGAITLGGTLNVANGGTGATTLTGYVYGNGTGTMTASTTIPNSGLANSAITINGSSVSLGGSVTVTATATNTLTIGTGLTGTSYNGSAAVTIAIDSTVATLTGAQTLTNKTISGSSNTLSNIANASLTNSAVTIGSTSLSLGNTLTAFTGVSISGSTNTLTNIGNASLTNSSVTVGTTAISLGSSSLTLGGLTSVAVTQDPTTALQVATKQYVDGLVSSGITYHTPVKYEVPNTTGNLTATYNNGASGVGATLTNAGTLVAFTPDGTVASVNDRILVYNQTDQTQNGVYVVTTVGSGSVAWVLTRASDADTYALKSPNGLGNGDAFFITSGATGAGETYVCNTTGVITFGTTAITFAQISASQVYNATSPVVITGTNISLTTVPVNLGGTNLTSYTAGDLLYASGATTLSKLALGTQGQVLTAGASGPEWSGISGGTF